MLTFTNNLTPLIRGGISKRTENFDFQMLGQISFESPNVGYP